MHIAIKSILPLTHARARACFPTTFVARRPVRVVGGGGRVEGMKEGRGGGEGNDDMIRHRLPPSVGRDGTREGRPDLSPLPLFLLLHRICFFSFFVVEQSGGSLNLGSE